MQSLQRSTLTYYAKANFTNARVPPTKTNIQICFVSISERFVAIQYCFYSFFIIIIKYHFICMYICRCICILFQNNDDNYKSNTLPHYRSLFNVHKFNLGVCMLVLNIVFINYMLTIFDLKTKIQLFFYVLLNILFTHMAKKQHFFYIYKENTFKN